MFFSAPVEALFPLKCHWRAERMMQTMREKREDETKGSSPRKEASGAKREKSEYSGNLPRASRAKASGGLSRCATEPSNRGKWALRTFNGDEQSARGSIASPPSLRRLPPPPQARPQGRRPPAHRLPRLTHR